MKISIITTSFNSASTIEDTIKSVLAQSDSNIEHIFIDGGSTDGTLNVIKGYQSEYKTLGRTMIVVSEKDGGIYDAMNKGIRLATGDIIGILNSDDFYAADDIIKTVMAEFGKAGIGDTSTDCVWGDLVYVDKIDTSKIVRSWKSSPYKEGAFRRGWHPPHPTFFVRKEIYKKYGSFRTDLSTSADYELMLRFLEKNKVSSSYIPRLLVKMRHGGVSTRSYYNWFRANIGCYRAFRENGLKIDPFFIIRKPLLKFGQFINL